MEARARRNASMAPKPGHCVTCHERWRRQLHEGHCVCTGHIDLTWRGKGLLR